MQLSEYMSGSIRNIMAKAYKSVLTNPREAMFVLKLQKTFARSEKRRAKVKKEEGLDVPPFLISSISTTCNLSCKGCYARTNGIADDPGKSQRTTMSPEEWKQVFTEAADLGIIFPIFTNGTLIGPSYMEFLKKHLNMVPVISIEGTEHGTDERRGKGMFRRAMMSMEMLRQENLFFGTSITVTTENMVFVTSDPFIHQLQDLGCKLIIYVEYVPTERGTEHLALSEADTERMEALLEHQREQFPSMIIISFPGDEKNMGGCLAGGRGFFHIGPDGAAEPCPFSPFSDSNVLSLGVRGALKSPLFQRLRDARLVGGEHTGGCALWEHREEVADIMQSLEEVAIKND